MKILSLTLSLAFFLSVESGFAQLKSLTSVQADTSIQSTTLLTPDMFFDVNPVDDIYVFSTISTFHKREVERIPIFESKFVEYTLFLSRSFIANKNDLSTQYSFTPKTVSEYNRQVKQQFFMAEPTSQQRRSLTRFIW